MPSLFDPADRQSVLDRLDRIPAGAAAVWGKMSAPQMLAHCSNALEVGTGDRPLPHRWIGRLLSRFVRSKVLGPEPFPRSTPTDPEFVIRDTRDFETERRRLAELVGRFVELGREHAGRQTHSFLGRLSGDEWGVMMYKHLDHHFRQFAA